MAEAVQIPSRFPVLPLRDQVMFPNMVVPILVMREKSIQALEDAMMGEQLILLLLQKDPAQDEPGSKDLYRVGVVARIMQVLKLPNGVLRVLFEGLARASVTRFIAGKAFLKANVKMVSEEVTPSSELDAHLRKLMDYFTEYVKLNRQIPDEVLMAVGNLETPRRLADTVAAYIMQKAPIKQEILEALDLNEQLEKMIRILASEREILEIEQKIDGQVRGAIQKNQREFYLHEQIKAIRQELGEEGDTADEIAELEKQIAAAKMPEEVGKKAHAELNRLKKMYPMSPESTVVRNYLDWLIALPWQKQTEDNLDLAAAQKILDEDHYGLKEPKERIVEYLAVVNLVKKIKGPILCLVGPPGTGKTSLGKSVARALNRKFIQMSLGGVRDEAEIRGHRRTYIGSLEVLDPEQNSTFNDHYLEVDFDLSETMFITTANVMQSIPPPLLDRMEVIRLPGYLEHEKLKIAQKFLIPKQLKEHGIKKKQLRFTDGALRRIIRSYTAEAGVRNLQREIAAICRKVARKLVEGQKAEGKKSETLGKNASFIIHTRDVETYLGLPKMEEKQKAAEDQIGVATGLAWTQNGGDILSIEVNLLKGKGDLTLTGKLGDVMQESARAALSYIRSVADRWGIEEDFYEKTDVHIHVPEGAIPKDGPSAGVTIATALLSALTNRAVRRDVAMTGEITLRGTVLAIGGLNEKVLAAQRAGLHTIILPRKNANALKELPEELKEGLEFVLAHHIDDVLEVAFVESSKE
ncbi:MAG: endopeptidase La [Candidatus Latescibacteria bacterium 4484_107]|nr:MAG: endopeptidase La [Candidatus Latescibacteria bacterium 4484_107]